MKTIGFITGFSDQQNIYRGMDAYAKYLWEYLIKFDDKKDLHFIEIKSYTQLMEQTCDLYHFPVFSLFFPNIPYDLRKPYVVTVHDVTRLEFPEKYPSGIRGKFKLEYQKYLLHKSKFIITDSYSSVGQISKYLRIPPSKIKMIYLAAPVIFHPQKNQSKLKIISDKYHLPVKFVLFNGDIDWNKNLTGLVQACNQLAIPLVIYGKSAKYFMDNPDQYNTQHTELSHLPKLKELLDSNNIHLLGYVLDDDLVSIFNLATVYSQPSFAEGFGIPVLQAMACGTPVVCSLTHSLPEVAGDAAIYFDPYNFDSLTTNLSRVLESSRLRVQMKKLGLAQSSNFSWDKTAVNTINVYQEALDK